MVWYSTPLPSRLSRASNITRCQTFSRYCRARFTRAMAMTANVNSQAVRSAAFPPEAERRFPEACEEVLAALLLLVRNHRGPLICRHADALGAPTSRRMRRPMHPMILNYGGSMNTPSALLAGRRRQTPCVSTGHVGDFRGGGGPDPRSISAARRGAPLPASEGDSSIGSFENERNVLSQGQRQPAGLGLPVLSCAGERNRAKEQPNVKPPKDARDDPMVRHSHARVDRLAAFGVSE